MKPSPLLYAAAAILISVLSRPGALKADAPANPVDPSRGKIDAIGTGEPKIEWRITVDLQIVAVSPGDAVRLTPALQNAETFDAAFAKLQDMLAQDKAELVDWPRVIIDGDKETGIAQSVQEQPFPAEFQAPQIPSIFSIQQPVPMWWIPSPTAWDTRNLGVTLSASGVVLDGGGSIALSVNPQRVFFLGGQLLRVPNIKTSLTSIFYIPQFQTSKAITEFTVRNGRRALMGATFQAKPAPQIIYFFIKATAERTGSAIQNNR